MQKMSAQRSRERCSSFVTCPLNFNRKIDQSRFHRRLFGYRNRLADRSRQLRSRMPFPSVASGNPETGIIWGQKIGLTQPEPQRPKAAAIDPAGQLAGFLTARDF